VRGLRAAAELSVIAQQQRASGIAVIVPRATPAAALDAFLEGIGADQSLLEPMPVSELFVRTAGRLAENPLLQTRARPLPSLPARDPLAVALERRTAVRSLLLGGSRLSESTSAALDTASPDARATLLGIDALLAGAVDADRTPIARTSALSRATASLDTTIGQVRLTRSGRITLTARRQDVPLAIVNETGLAVTAVLEIESDNVEIEGATRVPERPGTARLQRPVVLTRRTTSAPVVIETRGPGSFSMVVRLRTLDGTVISSTRTILRSTAVSGLGTVLTGLALGLLGLWWFASMRRTRRERSAA
jgi:hypothetical protein